MKEMALKQKLIHCVYLSATQCYFEYLFSIQINAICPYLHSFQILNQHSIGINMNLVNGQITTY